MKQTFLYLTILSLFAIAATGCSNSDNEYNADTALSYYQPEEYEKTVSSIEITYTKDNMDNSWIYNFVYDAHNRIKEINGTMNYYSNQNGTLNQNYIKREATLQTKYYYDNETLKIKSLYDTYIPQLDRRFTYNPVFYGCFDKEDGKLISFDAFDCEYEGLMLSKAHTDNGTSFGLEYDRNNNLVKAYQFDSLGINPVGKTVKEYNYSTLHKNATNIDFPSFFGYNIIERIVSFNTTHPYEIFHLGAFGMLGGRSTHLPEGEWEFKNDTIMHNNKSVVIEYPVKYTSSNKFVYNIKYKE